MRNTLAASSTLTTEGRSAERIRVTFETGHKRIEDTLFEDIEESSVDGEGSMQGNDLKCVRRSSLEELQDQ